MNSHCLVIRREEELITQLKLCLYIPADIREIKQGFAIFAGLKS